jgi:hypothetical protein
LDITGSFRWVDQYPYTGEGYYVAEKGSYDYHGTYRWQEVEPDGTVKPMRRDDAATGFISGPACWIDDLGRIINDCRGLYEGVQIFMVEGKPRLHVAIGYGDSFVKSFWFNVDGGYDATGDLVFQSSIVRSSDGTFSGDQPYVGNDFSEIPTTERSVRGTLNDAPKPCTLSVTPTSVRVPAQGGTVALSLKASPILCAWFTTTSSEWIAVTGSTQGAGPATLEYKVDATTQLTEREATIRIADLRVTVIQEQPLDTDEDGLWDHWETHGIDGSPLPGNPTPNQRHKDIYVYYNWLESPSHGSHEPSQEGLANVVAAFANAPAVLRAGSLLNPDGSGGVSVHFIPGGPIPETDYNKIVRPEDALLKVDASRELCAPPAILDTCLAPYDPRFARYMLFGHDALNLKGRQTSGVGWAGGPTFVSDLSRLDPKISESAMPKAFAGTIMHELGHSLGLEHYIRDGDEAEKNYGPNHISVMNYSFQLHGLVERVPTSVGADVWEYGETLDYSRFSDKDLPILDEQLLDEQAGLNASTSAPGAADRGTIYYCPNGQEKKVGLIGEVDWNCERGIESGIVSPVPIDRDSTIVQHRSGDEWARLLFKNSGIGAFQLGDGTVGDPHHTYQDEASAEEILANRPTASREIGVEIQPLAGGKRIKLRSRSLISIALLADENFAPASELDPTSITFGRSGYEAAARHCTARDVNRDRRQDLLCQFEPFKAGYGWDDVVAYLNGRDVYAHVRARSIDASYGVYGADVVGLSP